jgi:hypothetical protein
LVQTATVAVDTTEAIGTRPLDMTDNKSTKVEVTRQTGL